MGDDNEIWKIMPGFEEYEISSIGRVRRNGKILNHPEKRCDVAKGVATDNERMCK